MVQTKERILQLETQCRYWQEQLEQKKADTTEKITSQHVPQLGLHEMFTNQFFYAVANLAIMNDNGNKILIVKFDDHSISRMGLTFSILSELLMETRCSC